MAQMRRTIATAALAGLALVAGLAATPAVALDPVPIPKLRPADLAPPAGFARAPATQTRTAAPAAAPPQTVAYRPNSRFTREEQTMLANISSYYNSFSLMEGEFIQFGPDGSQSEGVFFMSRPGKIRFHYKPPAKLDIIANGSTVAIKNTRAQTQDMYPLSQTPLKWLLARNVDLTSEQLVKSIRVEPDLISVGVVEASRLVQGHLTLIFDRKTFELRQWVVTDAQGLNTSVAIFNTAIGKAQDRTLYFITPNPF